MSTLLREKFKHLKRKPGPVAGWKSLAAKELGYSRPYISNLEAGRVISPGALAALADWKKKNIPEEAAGIPYFPDLRKKPGRKASDLSEGARALGVNYSHLWRVLKGGRESPELVARYQIWLEAKNQAVTPAP